jgi:ABC-2 type transport system ATP-binding protein
MATNTILQLKEVSKFFDVYIPKKNHNEGGRMDGFEDLHRVKLPAVSKINLEIEEGDWVGIIGRNGSGKSTLLKIIAGIHKPDEGEIISSKPISVLPFFGPDEELHPEGSARDAVLVKAMQVGLKREDALKIYKNIIAFSELYGFTNQKIKTLSSGMKTRLILGLMLNINADLYLFDEIPATTDASFQQKVWHRLQKLKDIKKTAIVVSHNPDEIKSLCTKAILVHEGEIRGYDKVDTILNMYKSIK